MFVVVFFFKQKTAYEMRISDWSSDVFSSDLIETDKATMEFEAIDEGTISRIAIPEGAEGVKVGTVIAELTEEGESSAAKPAKRAPVASNGNAPQPESDRMSTAERSEERRGGQKCVGKCRHRWSRHHFKRTAIKHHM